jgi:hypothetical protein
MKLKDNIKTIIWLLVGVGLPYIFIPIGLPLWSALSITATQIIAGLTAWGLSTTNFGR